MFSVAHYVAMEPLFSGSLVLIITKWNQNKGDTYFMEDCLFE